VKNTTKALVKVIGFNATNKKLGADNSDPFSIEVVSITAPVAEEIVTKGSVYPVTWTTNATKSPVDSARVFYTFGSSGIWKPADGTVLDPLGNFSWNIPSPAKTMIVKLKVVLKDASGVTLGNAVSKAFLVQ
jgi:ribosomal protein L30E